EVDEQGAARAVHVTHARRLRDILELLAVTVVQQIAASVGPDHEHVEPAVVVVVGERRADGTDRQRQGHASSRVGDETLAQRVEPDLRRRDEQNVFAVAVAQRERRGGSGRSWRKASRYRSVLSAWPRVSHTSAS